MKSGIYVDGQTIITAAAIVSALLLLGGILFKAYKWYLEMQELREEIKRIKTEDSILCTGMFACLDGLEQLGANSVVTKTKAKLNEHLNYQAHE